MTWSLAFIVAFVLVGTFTAGWFSGVLSAELGRHPSRGEKQMVPTARPAATKRTPWRH